MFGIGLFEFILFLAVALVVLGPEKLPKAARSAGVFYARLRHMLARVQQEVETELNLVETRHQLQAELAEIREAEQKLQENMQLMQRNIDEINQTAPTTSKEKNLERKQSKWQGFSALTDRQKIMYTPPQLLKVYT